MAIPKPKINVKYSKKARQQPIENQLKEY